ncbi:MAG: M20 aminoacylase family protein [Cucumibacter sp.]
MPVINRFADLHAEIAEWRQDFHAHPELMYDVHRTAARVAELLRSFGVDEVATGIGRTGVVGVIRGKDAAGGRTIALRADMDALPIREATGKPYASTVEGRMHACGHDGHTAMLLGAARYLAETRKFSGTAVVIFQPAEEGGAGGKAMVEDGLMERFGIEEVYGLHNFPQLAPGTFGIRPGGVLAATDEFAIEIEGVGGHAAQAHRGVDPVLIAAQLTVGLQSIVSRNVDPLQSAVVSVTTIHAGEAFNIIPGTAKLTGTVRSLDEKVRTLLENRMREMVPKIAEAFGGTATIEWRRGYPVTINAPRQTSFAAEVAARVAGRDKVDAESPATMGGEDFSFMAQSRPGAYIFLGQGGTAQLHQNTYDFNDEIIPVGCSYWATLVETAMPLR